MEYAAEVAVSVFLGGLVTIAASKTAHIPVLLEAHVKKERVFAVVEGDWTVP
jgi:hypothetical protein